MNKTDAIFEIAVERKKPNTTIHIAEDVQIFCSTEMRWWHKIILRLAFGWKVEYEDE